MIVTVQYKDTSIPERVYRRVIQWGLASKGKLIQIDAHDGCHYVFSEDIAEIKTEQI